VPDELCLGLVTLCDVFGKLCYGRFVCPCKMLSHIMLISVCLNVITLVATCYCIMQTTVYRPALCIMQPSTVLCKPLCNHKKFVMLH
jgi:hypothetical protein